MDYRPAVRSVPRASGSRKSLGHHPIESVRLSSPGLHRMQILASSKPSKFGSEGCSSLWPRSRSGPCPREAADAAQHEHAMIPAENPRRSSPAPIRSRRNALCASLIRRTRVRNPGTSTAFVWSPFSLTCSSLVCSAVHSVRLGREYSPRRQPRNGCLAYILACARATSLLPPLQPAPLPQQLPVCVLAETWRRGGCRALRNSRASTIPMKFKILMSKGPECNGLTFPASNPTRVANQLKRGDSGNG
jgi:hypothetical protein